MVHVKNLFAYLAVIAVSASAQSFAQPEGGPDPFAGHPITAPKTDQQYGNVTPMMPVGQPVGNEQGVNSPWWVKPPVAQNNDDDGIDSLKTDAEKLSALQSLRAVLDARLSVEKLKADIRKAKSSGSFGDMPPLPQMPQINAATIPVRGESATQPRPPVSLIGTSSVGGRLVADILVEGQIRTVALGESTNVYNDNYTVTDIKNTSITMKAPKGSLITVYGGLQ